MISVHIYRTNLKSYLFDIQSRIFTITNKVSLEDLEEGEEYLLVPVYTLEDDENRLIGAPKHSIHEGICEYKTSLRYKFSVDEYYYSFDERLYNLSWTVLDFDDL